MLLLYWRFVVVVWSAVGRRSALLADCTVCNTWELTHIILVFFTKESGRSMDRSANLAAGTGSPVLLLLLITLKLLLLLLRLAAGALSEKMLPFSFYRTYSTAVQVLMNNYSTILEALLIYRYSYSQSSCRPFEQNFKILFRVFIPMFYRTTITRSVQKHTV